MFSDSCGEFESGFHWVFLVYQSVVDLKKQPFDKLRANGGFSYEAFVKGFIVLRQGSPEFGRWA